MDAEDTTNLRRGINRILYNDWDPIGVNGCAPSDEYSSYIPSILRLLKDGANEHQISDMLQKIAKEYMEIDTKAEVDALVAKKLRALMENNNQLLVADERTAQLEDERLFIPPVIQTRPSQASIVSADDRLRYKISAILFNDWDPIGVKGCAPSNEYENYVPSVLRLMKDGATTEQIGKLLQKIAKEMMGIDNMNAEANTLVAKKLQALMVNNNQLVVTDERTARLEDERLFIPPVIQPQPSSNAVSAEDHLGYKISAILFNDWDPIGMNDYGLLPDEYDIYVPSILHLLQDGASEQHIGKQLQQIASEKMGMHTKAQVNMLVAKKLRALIMDNHDVAVQRSSSLLPNVSADNDDCLRVKISAVLYNDWDPIGVKGRAPSNEYDDYASSVLRLLKDGANEEQISGLLQKYIGMNTKAEVNMLVAKKLRALMENEVGVDPQWHHQPEEYYRRPRYSPIIHHGPYYQPPPIASAEDRLQDKINDILYYAWDPIGMKYFCCLPRDKYKYYVPSILHLMKEGANVQQISQLLQKIAKEYMEIETKAEVNTLVARKLRALIW